MRFAALICALILYGLSGSPTPDHPGTVEAVIGALLIFAAMPDVFPRFSFAFQWRGPIWRLAGWAFLFYAGVVSTPLALLHDRYLGNILRDLVFVTFFLTPLWLEPLISARAGRSFFLHILVLWIGIAFSIRTLLPGLNTILPGVDVSGPLYLAIAPTVLFSAFYLTGRSVECAAFGGLRPDALVRTGVLAALAAVPCLALVWTVQRISLVCVGFCLVVSVVVLLVRMPRRVLWPIALVCVFGLMGACVLDGVVQAISVKTALVGVNSRFAEAQLVIDSLSSDALTALFGRGWGATIPSPATAGVPVNFTHSLVTMIWMKTGLVGLFLAGGYTTGLVARVVRGFRGDPVLVLALVLPIGIDLFLYASYKSLDFGLILLAASVFQEHSAAFRTARKYRTLKTSAPTNAVRA